MDAKTTVKKFIAPNYLPIIIITVIPITTIIGLIVLLCLIPINKRAKNTIAALEASGRLERAAAELNSATAKSYIKGNLVLTDNFIFCKHNGYIFTYGEVVWAYKHHFTQRVMLIPVSVTDSLYLATTGIKPVCVAQMGKDKNDEIIEAMREIYRHNPRCRLGYNAENQAAYKALTGK